MKTRLRYLSPLGEMLLEGEEDALTALFLPRESYPTGGFFGETPLLHRAALELDEYFSGQRQIFTVPLRWSGTVFQNQVWQQVLSIPYGETRSYQQIAEAIGNPRSSRAIGGAVHRNPLPIFIPCHRVVGKDGGLTGYGGGLPLKAALLLQEKQ